MLKPLELMYLIWCEYIKILWRNGLQLVIASRSMSIAAVIAWISQSSTFLTFLCSLGLPVIALFVPLLCTHVAMPHSTSRLYNSVSFSMPYTSTGLRPSVVYVQGRIQRLKKGWGHTDRVGGGAAHVAHSWLCTYSAQHCRGTRCMLPQENFEI